MSANAVGDLDVVDEQGRVIGTASFEKCHAEGLLHRGASVWLFRDASCKELLLQKRALSLKVDPGLWGSSASGHLDAGEDYHEAALRELREELFPGAKITISLEPVCTYRTSDRPGNLEFVRVFRGVYPGPFAPDPKEVSEVRWCRVATLRKDLREHPERFQRCFRAEWGRAT